MNQHKPGAVTVRVDGESFTYQPSTESVGSPCSMLWGYRRVDGRWRAFDGTGYTMAVPVGRKIKLDRAVAAARATVA